MNHYFEQANLLQKEVDRLKVLGEHYEKAKQSINIGTKIIDTEMNKTMIVAKLKNGCNDFEANPIDGGIGRGYLYIVNNWKVVD